jgi:hypothetical protein
MEAYSPSVTGLPVAGDFAAGMRQNRETVLVRGDFATGLRGSTEPLSRHHGDFAAGLRSHLHGGLVPGDFAVGLRAAESGATA